MKLTREQIEAIALREYPDPQHNSHWEREKVRFLRRGFIKGMEMMQEQNNDLHEQIRVLQADKEIRDANQERLDKINWELVKALLSVRLQVGQLKHNWDYREKEFMPKVEQALENAKQ